MCDQLNLRHTAYIFFYFLEIYKAYRKVKGLISLAVNTWSTFVYPMFSNLYEDSIFACLFPGSHVYAILFREQTLGDTSLQLTFLGYNHSAKQNLPKCMKLVSVILELSLIISVMCAFPPMILPVIQSVHVQTFFFQVSQTVGTGIPFLWSPDFTFCLSF